MTFFATRLYFGKLTALALGRGALAAPGLPWARRWLLLLLPVMPAEAPAAGAGGGSGGADDDGGRGGLGVTPPRSDSGGSGTGDDGAGSRRSSLESVASCSVAAPPAPRGAAVQLCPQPRRQPRPRHQGAEPGRKQDEQQHHEHHRHQQQQGQQEQQPSAPPSARLDAAAVAGFLLYAFRGGALGGLQTALQIGALWAIGAAMGCVMALASRPARAAGVAPLPHFDAPLRSESLAEFWGRRWNRTQAAVLRDAVFAPAAEGRLWGPAAAPAAAGAAAAAPPAGEAGEREGGEAGGAEQEDGQEQEQRLQRQRRRRHRRRRAAALVATFLVSGLEHELYHW